ncbi:MAG TPA: porin family protein [Chryseolinea sp.]
MKKITTLVFACLLGAVAYGQGISGGIKAGLNLANQTFSGNGYTTSPSFLPGIHGGAYVTWMFTEHLGLQPEVLYSAQGAKSGDQKYKVNYVNVPVLVRYSVNDLLSFHAGPQFGVLTSAKFTSGSSEQDMKDQVKGSDIGIAAGVGIDLPMKLNFSLRFIQGISNINDTDNSTINQKNYNLQLSVGYTLFGK